MGDGLKRAVAAARATMAEPKISERPTKACKHGEEDHIITGMGLIQCIAGRCLCSRRIGESHDKGLYA